MRRILIIGGGLSGCTVASKLAEADTEVFLVEKSPNIGGKVRLYGCKAVDDKCNNCGVCLACGLWEEVLGHQNIHVLTHSVVKDVIGKPGDFTAIIEAPHHVEDIEKLDAIVVSTGFESQPKGMSSHLHIEGMEGLMTGLKLEEQLLERTRTGLFDQAPSSVAFIQCLGSRDEREGGLYCSRVCCSYSTRTAKVLRSYYPECEITFFYMELQNVKNGNYYEELKELGMEFIKCRPLRIIGGKPVAVEYDDPAGGEVLKTFDLVILSEGIHEGADNEALSLACGLGQDGDGFLHSMDSNPGFYVAGCARAPMKIEEAYGDALATAGKILASVPERGNAS